jgi:hypothetical protein
MKGVCQFAWEANPFRFMKVIEFNGACAMEDGLK